MLELTLQFYNFTNLGMPSMISFAQIGFVELTKSKWPYKGKTPQGNIQQSVGNIHTGEWGE